MTQGQHLAADLRAMELPTRTLLERIPADQLTWKPHERSMTLGRLGMHIAELPHWIVKSFAMAEFDFDTAGFTPNVPTTFHQIPEMQDSVWPEAVALLEGASDAALAVAFTVKRGGAITRSHPRSAEARRQMMHIAHHRGQLTVYLRLLEVPVPELFGPTADTRRPA